MIKITVDAALKRSLDSEGRRDPLLQEIFHEGDTIAQCPACKSWMLEQSWEALGGSCACSYKPGSTDRVQIRRTEPAPAPETPGAAGTETPAPTPPPTTPRPVPRWILWAGGVALAAGLAYWADKSSPVVVPPPPPPVPTPIEQPTPRPQPPAPLEITSHAFEKWIATVTKQRGSSESPSCELTTPSTGTDGGAARSERSILVTVKAGYGMVRAKGPYRTGGEVLLQVHGAAYRLTDYEAAPHAAATDVTAIIEAFKAGLEARTSGTTISGSQTSDSYSLLGFRASFAKALEFCAK